MPLFPRSGGRFTGTGIENDYDPRITIRLRARELEKKKRTRQGDLRANGWRRKMVGTMFHLARTFIVRAL